MAIQEWPNKLGWTIHETRGEWEIWKPDPTVQLDTYHANYFPRGSFNATKSGDGNSWSQAMQNAKPVREAKQQ